MRQKKIETRHWATSYRGELLICAAKKGLSKKNLIHFLSNWTLQGGLAPIVGKPLDMTFNTWAGVEIEDLHFGKAVAIANLIDCRRTDDLTTDEIGTEEHFGDFSLGRFGWMFEDVRAIKPFPVKGAQGLFNVNITRGPVRRETIEEV